MHTIRLAVVDDHPLLRSGIISSLSEIGGFEIIGEGANSGDAIRLAAEGPDILLMDINMPGGGLSAACSILKIHSQLRIAVLTVSDSRKDLAEALELGIRGYILKSIGSRSLAQILRSIFDGEIYVAPQIAVPLIQELKSMLDCNQNVDPVARLTVRERGVLHLVAGGLSNKEVAFRLELQEKTVKHYMTQVMAKLGARNRTEAALMLRDADGSSP